MTPRAVTGGVELSAEPKIPRLPRQNRDNYFTGSEFSKKQVLERLQFGDLSGRNRSAIERKFSNVSAILDAVNAPWLRGFKPLTHVQRALQEHVIAVAKRRGILIRND
jgi:hypothetical protein